MSSSDQLRDVVSDALHIYHDTATSRSYQEMATAVLDAIRAAGWGITDDTTPHHIVCFTERGFTIKHPVACRPNLFACPVNDAGEALDGSPAELGTWVCDLDEFGSLRLLERCAL